MTFDEAIEILETGDEAALRELDMPGPESPEQLTTIIAAVTDRGHDYGTCVYAMSITAEAAFNFVAKKLRVTGFQASCADMDILKRTRLLKGPFAIIDGNDLLYPQYNIRGKVEDLLIQWQPWAKEEAQKLIDTKNGSHVSPAVMKHWQKLAGQNGKKR